MVRCARGGIRNSVGPWPEHIDSARGPADQLDVRHLDQTGAGRLLTVRGRKTGRIYSTSVDVMAVGRDRWLVAGYGVVNSVHNVGASGEATLSLGARSQGYRVVEAAPAETIPVLREYMRQVRVTAAYSDATLDSSDESVAAEMARHPVFDSSPSQQAAHSR